MKKMILTVVTLLPILISCSSSSNDTFFIHAVSFSENDGLYTVNAICEKLSGEKNEYFTVSQSGKSIELATKALMENNKDCYFATCRLYIIGNDCSKDFIPHLAHSLCDSNIYPTKASIICTDRNNLISFLKSSESFKEIDKITEKEKVNAVRFFSRYTSGKKTKLTCITATADGVIKQAKDRIF